MGKWKALDEPAFLLRVAGCLAGLTAEGKVAATVVGGRKQVATIALRGRTLLRWSCQKHLSDLFENTGQCKRGKSTNIAKQTNVKEPPGPGGQPLLV